MIFFIIFEQINQYFDGSICFASLIATTCQLCKLQKRRQMPTAAERFLVL